MALSEEQKDIIRTLVKSNYLTNDNPEGMSNRAIAKEAKCSESAVRTLIRREDLDSKKNAINALAKVEAHTILMQEKIKTQKNALTKKEKDAYEEILNTEKKTLDIATNFQDQMLFRQEADREALEAIRSMMLSDLNNAESPEEVIKIKMRYRDYVVAIVDYDDMKKGAQANDQLAITKKEAPRFAPRADITQNFLQITDTEAGTKGKW